MFGKKIAPSILFLIAPMFLVSCGGSSTPQHTPTPNATARFAFVVNQFSNSISSFAVDPQTGELNAKETIATGGMNSGVIAVDPSGRFAYVGNVASNDISV